MGIGVSDWALARSVAKAGQIGVVSGTAIDAVFVRRLQRGDQDQSLRFAMSHFPDQKFVSEVLVKYFVEGGIPKGTSFTNLPMLKAEQSINQQKLLVLANFAEVFLAKQGHRGEIGINFLEKIQYPVLPSLYGAMLAGVDYILMGAGIPREVPAVLDRLVRHEDVEYRLTVQGAEAQDLYKLTFSPKTVFANSGVDLNLNLKRPRFYAIIASTVLAQSLVKKCNPPVDGFIIEAPTAGGHNAPPRGKLQLNERGEPVYGVRDEVDFKVIADLGLPFWLAGMVGSREGLKKALSVGAQGIQVGTAFALCDESGISRATKDKLIQQALAGKTDVYTDPVASPTGFPFKAWRVEGTHSEKEVYESRIRRCDLGYLRDPYKTEDGSLGYRCASEPVDHFLKKGGTVEQAQGRKCLCNALMANLDLGQVANKVEELPLITIGDDVKNIGRFVKPGRQRYSALDVIEYLLSDYSMGKVGESAYVPLSPPEVPAL